tara:strand:- start:368 stop:568 length:201 start_codon:yes stop_codon:yes gene_type:complete
MSINKRDLKTDKIEGQLLWAAIIKIAQIEKIDDIQEVINLLYEDLSYIKARIVMGRYIKEITDKPK